MSPIEQANYLHVDMSSLRLYAKTKPRDLFYGMNQTEKAHAINLEAKRRSGGIQEWHYEGLTLKLGDDCRYTPDFLVIYADGYMELHETKGFMRDDALVKLRTAARIYPFRIVLYTLKKGVWTETSISPVPD